MNSILFHENKLCEEGQIVFVDSVDRLSKTVQEFLVPLVHSAMLGTRQDRMYERY